MGESGWTPWTGGDQPVPDDAIVRVIYRDEADPKRGVRIEWECPAARMAWHHDGQDDDIVAYRVVAARAALATTGED